jgi:hypothetical protein
VSFYHHGCGRPRIEGERRSRQCSKENAGCTHRTEGCGWVVGDRGIYRAAPPRWTKRVRTGARGRQRGVAPGGESAAQEGSIRAHECVPTAGRCIYLFRASKEGASVWNRRTSRGEEAPRRSDTPQVRCDGGGNRAKRESARARHSASRAPVLPSPSPMHNPRWPGWLFPAHRTSDHVRDGRSPLGWRRSEEKKWKRTCTAPPVPPMPSACHAVARSGAVFLPQRRFQPLSPPPKRCGGRQARTRPRIDYGEKKRKIS